MKPLHLSHKLLFAVSALVIGSGLVVFTAVSDRYSTSLRDASVLQGRYLCQAISNEVADIFPANETVQLQKLFFHHRSVNPNIAYIFIVREGELLAHTFGDNFPVELIQVDTADAASAGNHQLIDATAGDRYLDFAWPILQGRAGVLRLGLSEALIREPLWDLRMRMILLTLLVLLISLAFTLFCIGRFNRSFRALADALDRVDADHLDVKTPVTSGDEAGVLTGAFNRMIERLRDRTKKIEANRAELDRAYAQTRTSFDILKKIGSQTVLKDFSAYMLDQLGQMVPCSQLALLVFCPDKQSLYVGSKNRIFQVTHSAVAELYSKLSDLEDITYFQGSGIPEIFLPGGFREARRLVVFPFHHENQLLGALLVACPVRCECNPRELEIIDLLMQESAGVVQRIVQHETRLLGLTISEKGATGYGGLVGKAPQMRTLYALIDDIAPTDAAILIQGESGTGKELVARAIHDRSHRKDGPFVVINCSAYPATLLESELFGHEKGAFTGAIRKKTGRFEQATGGTVFLDEIGEIPSSAQVRLLRILQTRKYERVGGEKTLSVDARIISATNRDLLNRVKSGNFREDLYYRLNVIPIHLPPLRERRNDIPLLARHFLARFAREHGKVMEDFSSESMAVLLACDWPGNVREIEHAVEHAAVLAKEKTINVADLPAAIREAQQAMHDRTGNIMAESEIRLFQDILEACRWNKKEGARRLGISRNTLYRKLKKYGITPPSSTRPSRSRRNS